MIANSNKAALYAPNTPWNQFTPEALGPSVMNYMQDQEPFFRRWAEVWYENFQFLFGQSNIKWSRRYGFAVDYDFLKRDSGANMRANTNLARVIAEALASYVFGNLPDWDVDASDSSSIKGKRYKKICEKLLTAYMTRLLMEKEFKAAAMIYVLFGQFACEIDWNPIVGQLLEIPKSEKKQVPIFSDYMAPNPFTGGLLDSVTPLVDSMGQPMTEERWMPVLDAMGRQVVDKIFTGDVSVNMLTPLEYRREMGQYGIQKSKYIQRIKLMDYDDWLDYYKRVPGQTRQFEQIRPVYSDPTVYSMATRHFMRMQFTTPPSLDDNFSRTQSIFKSSMFKYKVFVVEHWDKPHPEKWPQGRRVVISNGACTHITAPNYSTNKMDGWHPFVEAQWLTAAPSSISAGPINDVIRKNKELNVADSLNATAMRRNMGSQLILKNGAGFDPQRMTGEPGMSHEVQDIYGARYLHDEMPIPPVVERMRAALKEDVYETSGAGDALRGEPSSRAQSGYQAKQDEEREEKRLAPARRSFESAAEGIGEKIISCLRANVVKLDDSVMGFMKRSGAGEFTSNDVIAFLSSSIDFGVDIKIVKSSMLVKSEATKMATTQEVAAGEPLNQRLMTDGKVLDEYLKQFGLENLRGQSAAHRDRAGRENEAFLDMIRLGPNTEGISKPIVIPADDDNIHIAEHTEFEVQNFEEMRNTPELLEQFLAHIEQHRLALQEKAGELMPGTALQTGSMMQMTSGVPAPDLQQIEQGNMARNQVLSQGKAENAPAPRLPSEGGAKGGRLDPNAPSKNTPAGKADKGGL